MNKLFDSDEEGQSNSQQPPRVASAVRPKRSAALQQRSALDQGGSDDEDDRTGGGVSSPPAAAASKAIPQFRRAEWQPPASQLPASTSADLTTQQQPPAFASPSSQPASMASGEPSSAAPPVPQSAVPTTQAPPQWMLQQQPQQTLPPQQTQQQPPATYAAPPPAQSTNQVPFLQQQAPPPQSFSYPTQSTQPHSSPHYPPQQQQQSYQAPPPTQQPPQQSQYPQHTMQYPPQQQQPAVNQAPAPARPPPQFEAPAIQPQRPTALQHVPPTATPPLAAHAANPEALARQAAAEGQSWENFVSLKKQLEEAHSRTMGLHAHISQLQLTHEKEAAQFREAANTQIEQQRKALDQLTEHYHEAQAKIESMSTVLHRKAEAILKSEQRIHELNVQNAAIVQKAAHTEDRVKLADSGRQIAEVRARELELTLEHSAQLVQTLRSQLSSSQDDKLRALQLQHDAFERNRQELIQFYNQREEHMVREFNLSIKQVQSDMEAAMQRREAQVSKHWQDVVRDVQAEQSKIQEIVDARKNALEAEAREQRERVAAEQKKFLEKHEKEIATLEQRHKEREDHVLVDIARRERELGEREQRARVQRVQDEQDAKIALATKEAELKGYYEKIVDDLRRVHEQEREKAAASFRDQVQQLSSQHLNNERELERLHRDKEREMAQRYRVAGYEVDDKKGMVDLQGVTQQTQASLLSKFDSLESRRQERAEQTRAAVRSSTSFSNVGLPPSAIGTNPPSSGSP